MNLFTIKIGWAQQIVKHFTVNDGLPSSEVYYVHQDFDGNMWFCTDRGVSRYNGYEFENFTTNDGLTHNTVFKVFEDKEHNLWFTCFNGDIFIRDYKTGKFKGFALNKKLKQHLGEYSWIDAISIEKDTILFFPHHFNRSSILIFNVKTQLLTETQSFVQKALSTEYRRQNILSGAIFKNPVSNVYPSFFTVKSKMKDSTVLSLDSLSKGFHSFYSHKDKFRINEYNSFIEALDYYDSLIVLCTRNGVEIYVKGDLKAHLLSGITVTSSELDDEGNLWVSTVEGVYIINLINFKKYDLSSILSEGERLTAMNSTQNRVIAGTSNNKIVEPERIAIIYENSKDWINIKFFSRYNEKLSYFPTDYKKVSVWAKNEKAPLKINIDSDFQRIGEGPFLRLNINAYEYFQFGTIWYSYLHKGKSVTHLRKKIHHACLGNSNTIYYSTSSDIFSVRYNDFENPIKLTKQLHTENVTVRRLQYTKDSLLLLCTSGKGLILTRKDTLFAKITKAEGLPSNIINSCYIDEENGRIWCATNKGLSIIDYQIRDNRFTLLSCSNLNSTQGLPSNAILEITGTNDQVWLAFDQSVVSMAKNFQIKRLVAPAVNIISFTNEHLYDLDSIPMFKYDENNVEIKYSAMSLQKPTQTKFYRYRLVKNQTQDSIWSSTNEREVQFKNLSSGNYLFEISARSENSKWGIPKTIFFSIKPYFFDRLWVRVGLISFLAILMIFGVKWRIKSLNRKNQKALEMKELQLENHQLELASLRGQMNPHFIFNVLQSIQKLILQGGKWEANKLLGRFSKLIRSSLEYSRIDFIPLTKEIDYLKNYLQIEKQRTPNKFNYSIVIESTADAHDLTIPALLIQPICENAIKHAFEKEDGKLTIKIRNLTEDLVEVQIIDDGVGYLNAPIRNPITQHSMGMKIVQSRLELFKQQGYNTRFTINSLNETTSQGTVVTLNLPCQ